MPVAATSSTRGTAQLPVYYINLTQRADRRAFMEEQFERLGIGAERIAAVGVTEVPADLREAAARSIWEQTPASLACALSHRLAWTTMVEKRQEAALILEDDVVLADGIAAFLAPDVLERAGLHLLRLETYGRRVRLGSTQTRMAPGLAVRRLLTTHPGAAAYIIARPIATPATADPDMPLMEVDRYLFGRGGRWLEEVAVGQAIPAPCIQLDRLDPGSQLPPATSDIAPVRRGAFPNDTKAARSARRAANLRYTLGVAARLIADPAALLAAKAAVPFAGAVHRHQPH